MIQNPKFAYEHKEKDKKISTTVRKKDETFNPSNRNTQRR